MTEEEKTTVLSGLKGRAWELVAYPESVRENWCEVLENSRLPYSISPLHDLDVKPLTGELKRPHWHVLVVYPNAVRVTAVRRLAISMGANEQPELVHDVRGAFLYQTHANAPDKHQYDGKDRVIGNGFSIEKYLRGEDKAALVRQRVHEITLFAGREHIGNFYQLYDMVFSRYGLEYASLIVGRSHYFSKVCEGVRYLGADGVPAQDGTQQPRKRRQMALKRVFGRFRRG